MVFATVSALAAPFSPAYVTLVLTLNLMIGLVKLGLGIARLGALVDFISTTVIVGFTAGAAFLIVSAQLRNLFGLAAEPRSASCLPATRLMTRRPLTSRSARSPVATLTIRASAR